LLEQHRNTLAGTHHHSTSGCGQRHHIIIAATTDKSGLPDPRSVHQVRFVASRHKLPRREPPNARRTCPAPRKPVNALRGPITLALEFDIEH
ncbi:hypothetical protein, partial [Mycobacterium mantenii]|uniref:hypothetical protein n=1 Tax=Mycobacterium mantenii TaxID=560555 RepID=UPI0021F2FD59